MSFRTEFPNQKAKNRSNQTSHRRTCLQTDQQRNHREWTDWTEWTEGVWLGRAGLRLAVTLCWIKNQVQFIQQSIQKSTAHHSTVDSKSYVKWIQQSTTNQSKKLQIWSNLVWHMNGKRRLLWVHVLQNPEAPDVYVFSHICATTIKAGAPKVVFRRTPIFLNSGSNLLFSRFW